MRVGHEEYFELVLWIHGGSRVIRYVPALLPSSPVGVVKRKLVVNVGHARLTLQGLRLGKGDVSLGHGGECLVNPRPGSHSAPH